MTRLWSWLRGRTGTVGFTILFAASVYGHWSLRDFIDDDKARDCIGAWEARQQIREAITIPGEAIIEVAADADPERVELFRASIDRRVHEAFPDPDCNLKAAERRLGR